MTAGAQFHDFAARLDRMAKAPFATEYVTVVAEEWEAVALARMGKDTHQLERRTRIRGVTGTPSRATATLEADTPYAGYHNYGTSTTGPNRFWDLGLDAAERRADLLNARAVGGIERMMTSGGVWNPRSAR